MKRCQLKWLIMSVAVCLVFGLSSPGSAGQGGNGNGFPSGDHYNLNLIAKKSDPNASGFFTCPDAAHYQWDYYNNLIDGTANCGFDAYGKPDANCVKCTPDFAAYPDDPKGGCDLSVASAQNVIFVPRDGTTDVTGDEVAEKISILIQSGANRPGKKTIVGTTLKVTDWCTEHFADAGGGNDPAVFQLPENTNGYRVYARVTGKPLEGTAWTFMTPQIQLVKDEYGNDLYWLGTIGGANSCTDPAGNILYRIDPNRKGKGVKPATDLSCLFNFTGDVCYVNDLCYYCPTSDPCDVTAPIPSFRCCDQGDPTELCGEFGEVANYNCVLPILECVAYNPENPAECIEWGSWVCPEGKFPVDLQCHNYTDTWVFNIADFVDVLWQSKTEGAYVVQLRFYKN